MKQTFSLKQGVVLFLVFLCITGGCTKGSKVITASPANEPTVRAVTKTAEQMLTEGNDIDVILTAMEDQLKESPRVFDVALESETGSITVVFVDGETHTFTLEDAEKQADDESYASSDLVSELERDSTVISNDATAPLQQQVAMGKVYRMPANNKALLANTPNYFDAGKPNFIVTDSTELIEKMLKARGYDVNNVTQSLTPPGYDVVPKSLTVDIFNNLTNYGVILIETHGGRRELKYPQELLKTPNCGGPNSSFRIVTSERATEEKILQYARNQDLFCGRVDLVDRIAIWKGKKVVTDQFFAVTPNYIREHDKKTFPDNTLMLLNACGSYLDADTCPMRDVFFEKANKGARFLGWTGKVRAKVAIRAALNLFQLMTVSNEEKILQDVPQKWAEFKDQLRKSTPPQGGQFTPLTKALDELNKKSYTTDSANGTELKLSSQEGEDSDLILMPHPLSIWGSLDYYFNNAQFNYAQLFMYSDSQPTVTIGATAVTVTPTAGTDTWALSSVPVGAYGDIVVSENGRTSIPRPLHRWRPQIKLTSVSSPPGLPFLKYEITFTLQARSTLQFLDPFRPDTIRDSFRDSIDNAPPPAQFSAFLDWSASNVAWKASGEGTEGGTSYKYQGSGLKTFAEVGVSSGIAVAGGVLLYTDDSGTSVHLSIDASTFMPVTMTTYDNSTGETHTYDAYIPIYLEKDNIAISDDWGVFPDSFQADVAGGGMAQISWNTCPAEPAFKKIEEPR